MPGASQDMVGPFGCKGTLLAYVQLDADQNPQIPFWEFALQPLTAQSIHTCISRVAPSQVQSPIFALVKFPTVGIVQPSSLSRSLKGLSILKGIKISS